MAKVLARHGWRAARRVDRSKVNFEDILVVWRKQWMDEVGMPKCNDVVVRAPHGWLWSSTEASRNLGPARTLIHHADIDQFIT